MINLSYSPDQASTHKLFTVVFNPASRNDSRSVSMCAMRGQVKGQAGEAERLVCRKGCPMVLSGDFPRNRGECFVHVGLLVRMPKWRFIPWPSAAR